jgi:glutathione synthase/RimK-type ligase-like ATP-grasp enzyme
MSVGENPVSASACARMPLNERNMSPPLLGNAALMRLAMAGKDLAPLGQQLLARAAADPQDANALMDMSTLLQLTGQRELALAMQRQALDITALYHLPAAQQDGSPPLRLLAFMTPGDLMSNTPLDCLLEDANVALDMLYMGDGLAPPEALPEHDLLFIAIGPSAHNALLLAELAEVTRDWPRPLINRPEWIARTARDLAGLHLRGAPGVVMPATQRIPRAVLNDIGNGSLPVQAVLEDGRFPLIARPIDTHAGQGMVKIEAAADIAAFLDSSPETEFHISSFIDYRNADGLYRKYRVVLIGGQPYASHMGISSHWMIHYLNAGMSESAAKREEEARFMASFDNDFAPRHAEALAAVHACLPLDYLVIDCAEAPPEAGGGLLIFEVDTSAVVHAMDPPEVFPYKQAPMQKAFQAFRSMLDARQDV